MRVARILGLVLIGVSVVLIAVIVGAVVVLNYVDFNHYKPVIAEEVRKTTGRELAISGDVRLDISFAPGVVVEGVTLSNAAWGSRPDMVSVRRLKAQVVLTSLIFGVLEFARIELAGADILLETDSQGRANFAFEPPADVTEEPTQPEEGGTGIEIIPLVHQAVIRESLLTYMNGMAGASYSTIVETLTLSSDGPDDPINLVYAGSYNDAPIRANATLGTVANLLEPATPWPVDLAIDAGGAAVTVNGMIAAPLTGSGLDLALTVGGDEFGDISELTGTKVLKLGAYSLSARVVGNAATVIEFAGLKAQLGDSDISGEVSVKLTGEQPAIEADLVSDEIDLAALGAGINATLRNAAAEVSVKDGTLEIESFNAKLAGAAVTLQGSIARPLEGGGLDLAVSLKGDQTGDLSEIAGAKVPALGGYSLSAQVTGDAGSKINLAGLKAQIGAITLTGEAAVTPDGETPAIDAKLASRQIDLAALGAGVDAKLQDTVADLSLKGGQLTLRSLETTFGGATVSMNGTIADATKLAGLNLAVAARGDRFGALAERFGGKLPALGAYSMAGRVSGDLATTIVISQLVAQMGGSDISGDGQVTLSGEQPAVDARLASDKIDLAALGVEDMPLRRTVAVLSLKDGKLYIRSIETNLFGAKLIVEGTIADPGKAAGLDLTITARGREFGELSSALAGRDMPPVGSYAVSTRVAGDAAATIRWSGIKARVGESDLAGEAQVTLTGARPFIDASFSSKLIDLSFLGGAAGDADSGGLQGAAVKPDRIFPDDPLPLEGLKAVDAKLRFDAATVVGRQPLLSNAAVILSLRDGLLDVQSLKAKTQNGDLDGAVQIDGRTESAGLAVRMTLHKVDLATMLAPTTLAGTVEGQVNFDFDVKGRGNSVRRIMGSLDGRVSLAMGKGRIRSRTLQTWVGGPTQMLRDILTLNVAGYTRINCALGVFDIAEGVATTSGTLLDTDVAAFVTNGTVNLGAETLNLVVTPHVKRTTLSVAVPVRIRGTLANPDYSSDPAAVRRRVGGLLGGLVYPPALLLGLGELGTFSEGDCVGLTASSEEQITPEQTDQTTGQKPSRLPGRILEGTGETITKGLKKVLGE